MRPGEAQHVARMFGGSQAACVPFASQRFSRLTVLPHGHDHQGNQPNCTTIAALTAASRDSY
jgi:hypothetical protein